MCVCVWERDGEKQVFVCERERQRKGEKKFFGSVRESIKERVCEWENKRTCERERKNVCVWVYMFVKDSPIKSVHFNCVTQISECISPPFSLSLIHIYPFLSNSINKTPFFSCGTLCNMDITRYYLLLNSATKITCSIPNCLYKSV